MNVHGIQEPDKEKTSTIIWRNIVGSILIALCSGSIGYGYSQSTMVTDVRLAEKEIVALKQTDLATDRKLDTVTDLLSRRLDNSTEVVNHRIDKVADLVGELVKQNTELITLLRVQNALSVKQP